MQFNNESPTTAHADRAVARTRWHLPEATRFFVRTGPQVRPNLQFLAMLVCAIVLMGGSMGAFAATSGSSEPLARDDVLLIEWDGTQHELDVLANDSGAGDLTVVAVGPTSGSASIRPDEEGKLILFWPAGEFRGAETFTYTMVDGNGMTSTGRVKVTEQFDYVLTGRKTWALSYGFGGGVLGGSGFSFSQSLTVDLWAEALGVLTVSAQFDDQSELKDQHLSVELETEYVTGVLGDFSLSGAADLFVYNRTMTGIRLDVFPAGQSAGGSQLTVVASQLQGISRSMTIVGESAPGTSVFSAANPDSPWEEASYTRNIDGLASYPLDEPIVRGITVIEYDVLSRTELAAILTAYELAPIAQALEAQVTETPPLESSFMSLADVQHRLVLKSNPYALLRTITRESISDYNRSISDSDSRISYPFVQGSDLEAAFLDDLGTQIAFIVNEQLIPVFPRERNRFYNLGHASIDPASLSVDATSGDHTVTLSEIDAGEEGTLNTYRLYRDAGVLELWLADAFFTNADATITATYSYAREGQLIVLDFGAVADSIQVMLNGRLLEEGIGYEVDDTDPASVFLLEEVGPEDVVQIEYEQFRGGLGSPAEFATSFLGAQVTFPIGSIGQAQLSVLRSADIADGAAEDPTMRTMPNEQTVVGFDASFDLDPLRGSLMLGYNDNVFPSDDNVRPSLPNRITAIEIHPQDRWVLFAHYQGLTVLENGDWETFDGSTGLASQRIYDLAVSEALDRVYLATAAGLTVVDTQGESPFDRLDRWTNLDSELGLPTGEIRAVAIIDETIWVAAEDVLAYARWDEVDLSEAWQIITAPGIDPRALVKTPDGRLLIGAEEGAWWLDPGSPEPAASLIPILSLQGIAVRDIAVSDDRIWIASAEGLVEIDPQGQSHWLVRDQAILSVCVAPEDGGVLYTTEDALFDLMLPEPILEAEHITAVACSDRGVWAGQQATADPLYTLLLWSLAGSPPSDQVAVFDNTVTGIDGRDPVYFSTLDPDGHTSTGWMMRLAFRRDYDIAELDGSFTVQDPGFSSIGRIDRSDVAGWSLSIASGADAFQNFDYHLSHEYLVSGQSSVSNPDSNQDQPVESELKNGVDVRFDLSDLVAGLSPPSPTGEVLQGPVLSAELTHTASSPGNGSEGDEWRVAHSLQISDSLFALDSPLGRSDLLSVSLRSSGTLDELLRRTASLGASAAITPPGAISVDATWNRMASGSEGAPITIGRESFSLSADWQPDLRDEPFTAEASYSASATRSSQRIGFSVDHRLNAELRLDSRPFAGRTVSPRFEADASLEDGAFGFEFQVATPIQTGSRSLRPTIALEVSGLGELRTESEQRVDVSYYDRSSDKFQPSVSSTLRRTTVAYIGSKSTSWSLTLAPRLKWTPVREISANVTGSITATLANEQWTMTGSIRSDASAPLASLFPRIDEAMQPPLEQSESAARNPESDDNSAPIDVESGDVPVESWRSSLGASVVSAEISGNSSYRNHQWSFNLTTRGQVSVPIGDTWSAGLSLQGDLSKIADLGSVDLGWLIEIYAAVQF
ncbi:hypothetical protein JW848_06155 [Candidatus Bipolaricaulota bacterium]|nr:hypothetical protein [Candidatus Bipolaricaulota bacterium]